ncbi:MAG: acyl-CoA dehydrogenase family protein [Mycobacteriales bacterium]
MTSATSTQPRAEASLEETRAALRAWLESEREHLARLALSGSDVKATFTALRQLQRMLFDAGWIRLGWPAELGGLGGSMLLRCIVAEELALAGYPPPFSFGTQEVLGPAVARYAPPDLAAEVLPRLLRGDETWCQGFSEPAAGSDLAALQLRAVDEDDHWRLSGEKVWTSWAHVADRCVLLARTGDPTSGHRGITAMLMDMGLPGLDLRPLVSMNGDQEFCSLYFDDVRVPKSRTLGDVHGGWAVAMTILASERGAAAWQRQTWLRTRLQDLLTATPDLPPTVAGEAFELVHALRLLSRRTVRALATGEDLGASPSFDKLLMSTAEKFLFDAVLEHAPGRVLLEAGAEADAWRNDWLYARASSIYGGAAEIQRNILAERVLRMPRES